LLTGKNTCRIKQHGPPKSPAPSGKASYDRSAPVFAFVVSSEVETFLTVAFLKTRDSSASIGMTKW
jgi:hypothetical protein